MKWWQFFINAKWLRERKSRVLLAVLTAALGIAVFLAIQLSIYNTKVELETKLKSDSSVNSETETIEESLPGGWVVSAAESDLYYQNRKVVYLGLDVISIAAILAAVYIIFYATNYIVQNFIHSISILRSMGATAGEINCICLKLSSIIGWISTFIGIIAGIIMSFFVIKILNTSLNTDGTVLSIKEFPVRYVIMTAIIGAAGSAISGILNGRAIYKASIKRQKLNNTIQKKLMPFRAVTLKIFITSNLKRVAKPIFLMAGCVTVSVGICGIIIGFKNSYLDWVNSNLKGDYVIYSNADSGIENVQSLFENSIIENYFFNYSYEIKIENNDAAIRSYNLDYSTLNFTQGSTTEIINKITDTSENNVAVSDSLLKKLDKRIGDGIWLDVESGTQKFKILGSFNTVDYGGNVILMSDKKFAQMYPSKASNYTSVFTASVNDETVSELSRLFGDDFIVLETSKVKQDNIKSIDNLFAIFYRIVAVIYIIALIIIILQVTKIIDEKRYQLSIIGSMGAGRKNIINIMVNLGFFLGIIGSVLGTILGIVLQALLIYLVKNYIGIDIQFSINMMNCVIFIVLGIILVLVSSVIVAVKVYKNGYLAVNKQ